MENIEQHRHFISAEVAQEFIKKYRDGLEGFKPADGEWGGWFEKEYVVAMLEQENCAGIRFYFALNKEDRLDVVLVGVDANGDDLPGSYSADRSWPCPPYCDINDRPETP